MLPGLRLLSLAFLCGFVVVLAALRLAAAPQILHSGFAIASAQAAPVHFRATLPTTALYELRFVTAPAGTPPEIADMAALIGERFPVPEEPRSATGASAEEPGAPAERAADELRSTPSSPDVPAPAPAALAAVTAAEPVAEAEPQSATASEAAPETGSAEAEATAAPVPDPQPTLAPATILVPLPTPAPKEAIRAAARKAAAARRKAVRLARRTAPAAETETPPTVPFDPFGALVQ